VTAPAPSTSLPAPKAESPIFSQTGLATWYGAAGQNAQTASGEPFDGQDMTAAHRRLAFGTVVRVTCLENGRMIKVRINDRGPYTPGRIIDLSAKAAELLGIKQKGTAQVRIEEFVSDQT
jgi:rare lipoprotein A